MPYFDSKIFNEQAFGHYVKNVPNPKRNELVKSGAIGANEEVRRTLSAQTGSLYARIPYFGNISPETSQNNDGATDIASSNTTTYDQGFVVASRMDSWTEKSFSKNITAGVDFMANVGNQINAYKLAVKQAIVLAILKGIFSMKTTGTSTAEKAAKEFISKHTYDVSGNTGEAGCIGITTLNSAMQMACGDNKDIFTLAIMHSNVATNLENLRLFKNLTYTDKDGVTRDLSLGTWNGRTVLIDDSMPVEEVAASGSDSTATEAYTKYTTYVLGNNSINLDDIGDSHPYEMSRDAKTNGGQDTLYVRDRYICGAEGISFEKPSTLTASASNADLSTGTNWQIINDGTTAIPHKAIPILRIISRG